MSEKKCTLTNDELREACHRWISDLCSQKREWVMHIPADLNRDPDLLLSEALTRWKTCESELAAAGEEIARLRAKEDDRRNMLEDVINALDLSEGAIEKHGPMGTPAAEMVKLVLAEKDRQIAYLKAGFVDIRAQPARIVDAEKLKDAVLTGDRWFDGEHNLVMSVGNIFKIIDSLAIPAPDYMGALRTLIGCLVEECMCHLEDEDCNKTTTNGECIDCWIDHALANPTKEGS